MFIFWRFFLYGMKKKSSLLISLFQGYAYVSMIVHCSLVPVKFFWIRLDNWLLVAAIFRLIFSNIWAFLPSPWYSHYSIKQTSSLLKNQFIASWRYHHLRSNQGMLYAIAGQAFGICSLLNRSSLYWLFISCCQRKPLWWWSRNQLLTVKP